MSLEPLRTLDPRCIQQRSPRPRIRVCFVIDNLSRAGTEMHLLLLLKHLDRTQVEPYLCLLDGRADSSRELEPNDTPVCRLGIRRLFAPHAARQAVNFVSFLRKHRIDIVQAYFPDSTRFAAPLAKAAGVRAVIGSRRNIGHWMTWIDARIAAFYNRCFIDKIIANCEAARNAAIEQERIHPSHVVVIPNGVDLEQFTDIGLWTPACNGQPARVGMVGNLRHVKGPDLLIQAARYVLDAHPNTIFEIAGGGDSEPYVQRIQRLGLSHRVRLLGSICNVPAFLSTLDVAVLPSRAEGLSNALLEYMAAGRPIVATAVGGNSELIVNCESGLLVTVPDSREIAASIIQLLGDPAMASRMAIKAKAVARNYTVESVATRIEDLYCTMCS